MTLPNTKAYYLASMIQTVGAGGGKDTDKWNRIDKQNDPYKYAQFWPKVQSNSIEKG